MQARGTTPVACYFPRLKLRDEIRHTRRGCLQQPSSRLTMQGVLQQSKTAMHREHTSHTSCFVHTEEACELTLCIYKGYVDSPAHPAGQPAAEHSGHASAAQPESSAAPMDAGRQLPDSLSGAQAAAPGRSSGDLAAEAEPGAAAGEGMHAAQVGRVPPRSPPKPGRPPLPPDLLRPQVSSHRPITTCLTTVRVHQTSGIASLETSELCCSYVARDAA